MEKTRYFTNVRGFSDGTKYIEVRPYTSILHGSYGTMVRDNWNLAECLRAVDSGNFKEIPDPNIKKPAPKTKRRWRKIDPNSIRVVFHDGFADKLPILTNLSKIARVEILS